MSTTTAEPNLDSWKQLLAISTKITADEQLREEFEKMKVESSSNDEPKADNMQFLELAMQAAVQGSGGPCLFAMFFELGKQKPEDLVNSPAKVAAAKELADMLEDYLLLGNFAEQFKEANGMEALTNLSSSPDEEIQLLYLRLIPSLAENRPDFQKVIVESTLFDKYMDLLEKYEESPSPRILHAVLSAVSSIVRGYEDGWLKFYEKRGIEKLETIVRECPDDKCAARAAHILWGINLEYSGTDRDTFANGYAKPYADEFHVIEEEFDDEEKLWKEHELAKAQAEDEEKKEKKDASNASTTKTPSKTSKIVKKHDERVQRLCALRNRLVVVYASLDQRIAMNAALELAKEDVVGEHTVDGHTFNFLKETFEKIHDVLLSLDRTDIETEVKETLSNHIKKTNRAKRLRDPNVKLVADRVAKHLGVPQWYTKAEMIALKESELAAKLELESVMEQIKVQEDALKAMREKKKDLERQIREQEAETQKHKETLKTLEETKQKVEEAKKAAEKVPEKAAVKPKGPSTPNTGKNNKKPNNNKK